MNVPELLQTLADVGIRLWEVEGKLHFRAPAGVLTSERRAALVDHKDAVLAHLRRTAAPAAADPAARHDPFPLTDVQAAYLLGRRPGFVWGGTGCHAYGELVAGPLDPVRLADAWRDVVARHDMLRAVILPDVTQVVRRDLPPIAVPVADLRGREPAAVALALEATRAEMSHRVYEPSAWPLCELRVSITGEGTRLHLSIDFLIADYVSIFVILDELQRRYEHPELPLPPLEITFRDCQRTLRERRAGAAYERHREYWLDRLEDFPAAPDLPALPPPAANSPVRFSRWQFALDPGGRAALLRHAAQYRLTSSAALLGAYAEVVGRWSRQQRFTLDLTLLDRPPLHPQIGLIVGDFTSVTLLEVDNRQAEPFGARARALQQQLGKDLDHRLFSGIDVIREIARRRGRRAALMPVVFTSALGVETGSGDSRLWEFAGGISQTPQVWIDCQAMDRNGVLAINWDVRDGVFPPGLVEDMFASFERLIHRLADDERTWNEPSPVPLPAAHAARRTAMNETTAPASAATLLSPALEWARRDPDRPCVFSDEATLSYGDVFRRAGAVQQTLVEAGVAPGDIVAVIAERGVTQVIGLFGALLAGAAYLPIETSEPAARRAEILADSGARVVLTDGPLDLASIKQINVTRTPPAAELPSPVAYEPDHLAYVIYTSGSTGKPKGVMITHRGAVNTIEAITAQFGIGPDDRVLSVSSVAFDLSVFDIFGLTAVGGVVVFPSPSGRRDPSHWASLVGRFGVTIWNSVPALMGMLLDAAVHVPGADLGSLRIVLLSGDWVPVELARRIRVRLPAANATALGGATEASIWSIFFPLQDLDDAATFVPYGRPLRNQTIYVLDDAMRPCPDGVAGQICIGGAGLALGYLNDADRTAAQFVWTNDHGRLYRTGDIGRCLPDGHVEILGRDDTQVKIRGHRVDLGEVEAALTAHPGVARACTVVTGPATGHRRLLAFIEPAQTVPPAPPDVFRSGSDASTAFLRAADVEDFIEYTGALNAAALAAMLDAFRACGLFRTDAAHEVREVLTAVAPRPGYVNLVRRWLRALACHGILQVFGNPPRYRAATRVPDAAAAWSRVERWPRAYDSPTLLAYFKASAESLLPIVRGERNALDLLFPSGRPDIAIALYEHSFLNRWGNRLIGTVVTAAAARLSERGYPPRILEIGGGVGGTTSGVLSALDPPYQYVLTDVSAYFLNLARMRLGESPSVRLATFDIDRDYRDQGFRPNSFDIVLCGDVLHVARNVPRTLEYLRAMLAPGGWLIAAEMTRDHAQILTSLELLNTALDATARYEDARASTGETFYSRETWLRLFESSGADARCALPPADDPFCEAGLCVFAVRYKGDRAALVREDLDRFAGARLPEYMVPADLLVVDAMPLTANGKIDRKQLAAWAASEQGAPEAAAPANGTLEGRVAAVWREVLNRADGGPDVDFFASGGDSLLAAQLAARLLEDVPEAAGIFFDDLLRRVLEGPTIAELAAVINAGAATADAAVETPPATVLALDAPTDRPLCLLAHDGGAHAELLKAALASHFHVVDFPVDRVDAGRVRATARSQALLRVGAAIRLVGCGAGNRVALELGRQLLETGHDHPHVTITAFVGGTLGASAGGSLLYPGDLTLLCHGHHAAAEAHWRAVCLGAVRIVDLDLSAPQADVASAILQACGA